MNRGFETLQARSSSALRTEPYDIHATGRDQDERLKARILEAWKQSDGPTVRRGSTPSCGSAMASAIGKKRVARLMRELGVQGVSRRRGRVRTTAPDKQATPALDLVKRDFENPPSSVAASP